MFTCRNENDVLELADKINADRRYQEERTKEPNIYPRNEKAVTGVVITNEEIVRHHNPSPLEIQRITTIRAAARHFLDAIDANCGQCADATAAKRKVREAMMTANAAIVLNGIV